MSILGVIVRARVEHAADVQAQLAALPGVDIAAHDGGRWVLVIEDAPNATAGETLTRLTQLPQVLNTSLVYEYSGPDAPAAAASDAGFQSWRSNAR